MSQATPALPNEAAPRRGVNVNFDPGFTERYGGSLKRMINRDGRFNVKRAGQNWRDANLYMFLINASWPAFGLIVTSTFTFVNLVFAALYWVNGADAIKGAEAGSFSASFTKLFFFSWHTLTTVGYGNMYPVGTGANAIASLEALMGLMSFAVATGLMFGRFSRPTVRFGFSDNVVLAPYRDGTSLQFRVVNRRANNLIEVEAKVLLTTVQEENGQRQRKFENLTLERDNVLFFPLTWTVVHPITEESPLFGKTEEDLKRLQAELLVKLRGFDDTFGQTIHSRFSYRYDEIMWGARFGAAFEIDPEGDLLLFVDKVGLTEPAVLPGAAALPEAAS